MSNKIPVSVVTGFLGSGKTTLLNRMLSPEHADPAVARRTALLINEAGAVGIDHERVRHLSDNVMVLESGCLCCSVRGELVDALRELFLDALHKRVPPFSRVLIETSGLADPAAVMHTLKFDGFLRDRYTYAGCITVVDCIHGMQHLDVYPQAVRQVVEADAIVFSKRDLVAGQDVERLEGAVAALNAQDRVFDGRAMPQLDPLLAAATVGQNIKRGASGFLGRAMRREAGNEDGRFAHGSVRVLTVSIKQALSQAAFSRVMGRVHQLADIDLLRLKGLLHLQGQSGLTAVHGVHRQLYPLEHLPGLVSHAAGTGSLLVFIVGGREAGQFEVLLHTILKEEGIHSSEAL